jgi:peptidoglycan/xylan/chitin deacetylase (PgdA/CDA1 family)
LTRRGVFTAAAGLFAGFAASKRGAAAAKPLTYAEGLEQAVAAMENGRHDLAAAPLKAALAQDRNEPAGLLAVGTLYLHTGSFVRAAQEFDRVLSAHPADSLGRLGTALAALALRKGNPAAALDALPASDVPAAPLLAAYARLLAGDAAVVQNATAGVGENEPDLLRLALAAFAALRMGGADNQARGETLLRAFLSRPGMARLAEDRAFVLAFERENPGEGGAPPLISAIGFPPTPSAEQTLSGRVTLTPRDLLGKTRVAFVGYRIAGGWLNATTNSPPFAVEWNTARLPNGLYTLETTAYDADGRPVRESARTVRVRNADAPASGQSLSADQTAAFRSRLLALLTPRPARKAAHFALAERATERNEGALALQHIEAVVAVDPNFRNARMSLRRYNLQVLGPREGVWRAGTAQKLVALTFDDGPNPSPNRTPALLAALKAANARATFFVVGSRVEKAPGLVRQMADDGHEVANHSYSHPNLALMSESGVERELCRTSVLIRQITGARPRFYRPPGGNVNRIVQAAAESLGMAGAFWTTDAIKHEEAASRADLARYVVGEARPGAIFLLHNAPDVTIAAVPAIVRGLRASGYELVTMSELVRRTGGRTVSPAATRQR